jgi:hypothetical protein
LNFFGGFPKNIQKSNFMKILLVGAGFFHAEGNTDKYDKANRRFSKFGELAYKQTSKFKRINQLDATINYRFIVCLVDTAQHVSDILMPIIRSLSTAAAASGLPLEHSGSSAVPNNRNNNPFTVLSNKSSDKYSGQRRTRAFGGT